jgi:hypothetical protein
MRLNIFLNYSYNDLQRVKQGNVVPVLNLALCHEDMGEWRYGSTILDLGTRWR